MEELNFEYILERSLHKLKSPITVIREGIALISDETAGPVNSEQKMFLKTVQNNIDRLINMLDDIHLYESYLLTEPKKEPSRESIQTLIQKAINEVHSQATKWNCTFTIKDLPEIYINICRDSFIIALKKILLNAIQFAPSSCIIITHQLINNTLELSITDTGIGIKAAHYAEIFKPFTRFAESNIFIEGGSGIGLAIADIIIKQHKGTIRVESEYRKGTTFTIEIPVTM